MTRHTKQNLVPVIQKKSDSALSKTIKTYLANFLSDHTRSAYLGDFRDFGNFLQSSFGDIEHPDQIHKEHVIAYRDHLRVKYSPTSINRKLSALSSLFAELKNERVISENPAEGIRRPPSIAKRPRPGFTDKEALAVVNFHATDTLQGLNNRAILTFLFYTGCRISECLVVKVEDLATQNGIPAVHIKGKGSKIRTIPVHPKLQIVLNELIVRRRLEPSCHLFTRVQRGSKVPLRRHSVHELLKRTVASLGLDPALSLHSSRRTVISNLLEDGARLEGVAELVGHSNINTTLRYKVRKEKIEDSALLTLRYKE